MIVDDIEREAIQTEARGDSVALTRFERWNAPHGRRFTSTWLEMFDEAEALARRPHDGRGWSFATFVGDYREKARVEGVYALSLDLEPIDKTSADPSRCGDPHRAAKAFADFDGLITTTRGHRDEAPRCRVVLPFDRCASADEYELAWPFGARMASRFGLRADPSTRDASRFWFLPSLPLAGGDSTVIRLDGRRLRVDELVEEALSRAEVAARRGSRPSRVFLGRYSSPDDLEVRRRRAFAYVDRMPPAISGQGGHRQTWIAALALVRGFELPPDVAIEVLRHYSLGCQPPWSSRELQHKIESATRQASATPGYLLERGAP